MNRLGMIVTVAHGSNETILQAVDASSDPVLWSHGGSRHFVDTQRSLTDDAARKIAAKGGVIGLHFGNSFHNKEFYEYRRKGRAFGDISDSLARWAAFEKIEDVDRDIARTQPPEPVAVPERMRMGVDRLVDVLDHWIAVAGEDHVALGSDFDGGPEPPRGMKDIADFPQLNGGDAEAGLQGGAHSQNPGLKPAAAVP